MTGAMAAARAIAAARRGEPEVLSLQEIHAPHQPLSGARMNAAASDAAPFGRRAATITAREQHGAYVVIRCRDPHGPRPQAGQFYMLRPPSGGAGERASGRSSRARSASCAPTRGPTASSCTS